MSDVVPEDYIETALEIADQARNIALRYWRTPLTVDYKADDSPVSVADKAIEANTRQIIHQQHPSHGFVGEEEADFVGDSEWSWIIDPIDGTKAFICGGYYWGVMIALCHHDEFVLGLIDFPALDERYFNVKGQVSSLNGYPIQTSAVKRLDESRALTTSPQYFSGAGKAVLKSIHDHCAVFSYGGDCFLSATIARGDAEVVIESQLNIYDIAAAVPIVQGAGGIVKTWQGQDVNRTNFKDVIICANETLYQSLDLPSQ